MVPAAAIVLLAILPLGTGCNQQPAAEEQSVLMVNVTTVVSQKTINADEATGSFLDKHQPGVWHRTQ